ncbi:DUF481 domain-containing protein [Pseudaeromonas paramecii]|uniref:DUF481 domain-containing protein n=1 Tax=Pseudaeromonas paramecii TaxID=2138166 RepID=A0ABP8Q242_9GAMM
MSLLLALLGSAQAVLWMENGDRLSGQIKKISGSELVLETVYGGQLRLPRANVTRWQDESGRLLGPETLVAATPPAKSKDAWEYKVSADASVKLKRGENSRNDIDLDLDTQLTAGQWRWGLVGDYEYDTSEGQTLTHKYQLIPKLDYFFHPNWFWRGSVDLRYDMLGETYLEVDYASGPGYRFWKRKESWLEMNLQAGWSAVRWRDDSGSLSLIFPGQRQVAYPLVIWGWDYQQPLGDSRFTLFSQGKYAKFVKQQSDWLVLNQQAEAEFGVRYALSKHLRLSWRSEVDWNDMWLEAGGQKIRPEDDLEWRHYLSLGFNY